MSKFTPICISDSEESDSEEKKTVFLVISDDEENAKSNDHFEAKFDNSTDHFPSNSTAETVKGEPVKAEPGLSSEGPSSATTTSPVKRFTLNIKRLKWLSKSINVNNLQKSRFDVKDIQQTEASFSTVSKEEKDDNKSDVDNDDDSLLYSPIFEPHQKDFTKLNEISVKSESPTINEETAVQEKEIINPAQAESSSVKENIKHEPDTQSPLKQNETMTSTSIVKSIDIPSTTSSLLKFDTTEPRKVTPKKITLERNINSPRKVGAFGSPDKQLKQTKLNMDSFSPKKLMTSASSRLDDNSSHTPSLHANQFNGYGSLDCAKEIHVFTYSQLSYLEGIEEEGHEHTTRYIDALIGLITPYRKPPPDLCFRLLNESLLKAHNSAVAVKTYSALKRIQAIHPVVPEKMFRNVNFGFIDEVVDRLEMSGCTCKNLHENQPAICLKASNALKTLTFIVDLMEKEAKCKITPYKTLAFRLVSLERSHGSVTKILSWINTCVKLCCSNNNPQDFYTILNLFQRLLQLSISVSENPDKCAENLSGELLNSYSQLSDLQCRTVFLQTLPSHLLRSKFLHLYAKVFCEKADPSSHDSGLVGIQCIIQSDCQRLPLKRDDVSNFEARMCSGFHRSEEECEEHAMVIAYSLQSYLFCHHKKLQSMPKKLMLNTDGLTNSQEAQNRRHLSVLDQEEIVNMGDKVQVFAGRLFSLCPSLTRRTTHLVELLSDMRIWDPW